MRGYVVLLFAAIAVVSIPAAASAAPQISANVTSVEFVSPDDPSGAFDPNYSETFQSAVTITNTGDVNVTSVEPSFASMPGETPYRAPDPFSVYPGSCNSYNPGIGPYSHLLIGGVGQSCTFMVGFRPNALAEGEYTETLKLRAFGPGAVEGNSLEIPLSASTANNSAASVSPSSLEMGLVRADTTSTKSVTLNSTGTSDLLLYENFVEITLPDGSYSLSPAFNFSLPDDCLRMDAGESCDIEVSFTPTNSQSYESVLWLRGNFGTIQVPLTGEGFDPQAEVTPNVRFGEKIVGNSYTGTASITASSFTKIGVDSAAISGPAASSYSLDYDNSKCQDLGFQEGCDFDVTFAPTTKGSHPADLVVTGNFGTKKISLSGSARTGTPARLDVRISGPRRAAPGSTVTLKAKVFNRGEVVAKGVNLKTMLPKTLAARVKPIRIKQIAAGKPVTEKIRIKVKRKAKKVGWLKIAFSVSAKSAKSGKSTRSLRIR